MSLDHEAIRRAYPQAVNIDDGTGAFDGSGNPVTIVQSQVDAARVALNAEFNATKYKTDRVEEYPSIEDQLDMQYWDQINGTSTWKDAISKVKTDNPIPA